MAQSTDKKGPQDLLMRIRSALVLAPPVLAATFFGSPYFQIMVVLGCAVLAWEWRRLCAFSPHRLAWLVGGVAYLSLPCLALIWLREDATMGRETIFWLFALVWATDIGAYACGRLIGGPKLAPVLSPNKTWAGLIGGMAAAGAVGVGAAVFLGRPAFLPLAIASMLLGTISQGGDLVESGIKRRFGIKDSSSLIPGHGGLLDRVDGLLAAAFFAALASLIVGNRMLAWL